MNRRHTLTTTKVNQSPRLSEIAAQIASARTRPKRFLAAVGLACDLSLDNSPEALDEAIEQALDCLQREDEDDHVWGLEALKIEDCASFKLEPQLPDSDLLHLLLEIVLVEDRHVRFQALECVLTLVAAGREDAVQLARMVMADKNDELRLH